MARKQIILLLVGMIALFSCGGMSKGDGSSHGEMEEIEFIKPVEEKIKAAGITCHIKGRTKSIHSIWQKMK